MGGNGMARPALLPQRPHLVMTLDPASPPLDRLLLSGRWRGWDGDRDGPVYQGHPSTTEGVIDGCERRPMRVEHLLEGFHEILEQVNRSATWVASGAPWRAPSA